MSAGQPPPRRATVRVRVTSPRMGAVRRPPRAGVAGEIDAQSPLGEVYMRSLVRTQLRLALLVCAGLVGVLGTLPLLFGGAPGWVQRPVLGLPLSWLVLGVLVYPAMVLAAWAYVRAVEHSEREFAELVERS